MSKLPYTYENSWFAALLYISGKEAGFIMRDDFANIDDTGSYVYADDVLDKVDDVAAYVKKLSYLIKSRGHLILSCLPNHTHAIKSIIPNNYHLLEESFIDGRVFLCFKEGEAGDGIPEIMVYRDGNAIGDILHAAAVVEEYAKQGFSVCLMVTDKMRPIVSENPHIKRIVPKPDLPDAAMFRFMDFWTKRVRLFVNLDWSIEGFLLKKELPGVSEYFWSEPQRRALCGKSYARNVADLSGLENIAVIKTYPGILDAVNARDIREKLGSYIFIQLSGSGDVHKWSPNIDKLCMMILSRTDKSIYISHTSAQTGMARNIRKHVDDNYGPTKRLVFSPVKASFLTNCEIAKSADAVIGPETGMLVALSHEESVKKILLVSHSSPTNFSDWKNTICLTAGDAAPCQPCHRIHRDFRYCNKDQATGAAKCMAGIKSSVIFDAITGATSAKKDYT